MAQRQRRVLVIDDDEALRELLSEMLTEEGWTVKEAADGLAALALLEGWRPDLIVLDHLMPRMDGPAFLHAQRARSDIAAIPVLLLSAMRDRDLQVEANQPGVVAAMSKPFDLDALLALVERLLAESEATRNPRALNLSLS